MKLSIFAFFRYKVEDLNNIDFDTYLGSSSDDEQKATNEDSIKKYRVSCWKLMDIDNYNSSSHYWVCKTMEMNQRRRRKRRNLK